MPHTAGLGQRTVSTRPLIKWTGGKGRELGAIHAAMPAGVQRLLEPFVGGGAVLFSFPSCIPADVNDMSADLIGLYRACQEGNPALVASVQAIDQAWRGVGSVRTGEASQDALSAAQAGQAARPLDMLSPVLADMVAGEASLALARKRRTLERIRIQGDIERPQALLASALKSALYTAVRRWVNGAEAGPARLGAFWFLREFAYGGMFRANAAGENNVPYGGMSYDGRNMASRLIQIAEPPMQARLAATRFSRGDFAGFLEECRPDREDFAFLDPPYDSPFSTYDGNAFGRSDHGRLAASMATLPCRWMLVISQTEFVRQTYCTLPEARVSSFQKGYAANIKQRFARDATHLVVTNYDPE
jgi:DNA adenine methylase